MRTYAAAIGGALLATLGLAAWQTRTAAPAMTGAMNPPVFTGTAAGPLTASSYAADTGQPAAAPTVVRCAPGQQAVLRQALVNGQAVTAAECEWEPGAQAGYSDIRRVPAQDIVEYPRPVPVRYVAQEPPPAPRRVVTRRVVEEKPKRSWKKTALVIGGSAGAGAGIGGLAGGKKGALIGAAIGGGAASIYEAIKRK